METEIYIKWANNYFWWSTTFKDTESVLEGKGRYALFQRVAQEIWKGKDKKGREIIHMRKWDKLKVTKKNEVEENEIKTSEKKIKFPIRIFFFILVCFEINGWICFLAWIL